MLCYRGLDLIGELLCGRPGRSGLTWLAVGSGEDAWDAAPPPADRSRTRLVNEVLRVPLAVGENLRYDPASGAVEVRVSLPAGALAVPLREVGLLGGDASARPGSGYLVDHKVHDRIDPGPDEALGREIRLELPAGLPAGARDLIGGLLARTDGLAGLQVVALGSDGSAPGQPPGSLLAESWRAALDPRGLRYDATAHAVTVDVAVPFASGPPVVAEAGLYGGTATATLAGSGILVDRQAFAAVDRRTPVPLARRFTLALTAARAIEVPGVVGRPLAEATAAVTAADLMVGAVREADGQGAAAGTVLAQAPEGGASVGEGAAVELTVAATATVGVPAVVGSPLEGARELLGSLGLAVAEPPSFADSDQPPGTVLAVAPPPGTQVPAGATVALTVAAVPQLPVPDVRGRTPGAAAVLLAAAGFTLAPPPYQTTPGGSTAGTVTDQRPLPGTLAGARQAVRITLATPWTVAVPRLAGATLDAAIAELRDAAAPILAALRLPADPPGLALGATSQRPAGPNETVGTVVEQSPAAGTAAQLYATVAVVVAGPPRAAVPELTGLDIGAAAVTLSSAGFALGAVTRRASDATEGTVVDQDPDPGSTWPPAGRVAVTVATPIMVTVPDLDGLAQQAAAEALASRSLTMGAVTAQAVGQEVRAGSVVGQAPPAGASAPKNSAVALTVAAGVPNLVGMTQDAALAALTALGLSGEPREEQSDSPPGTVLAQDPAAGSPAAPGQVVALAVAVSRVVAVPDVTGAPFADAVAKLADAGLTLTAGGRVETGDVREGSVVALAPPPGTRVLRGTTVTATLAVAPPTVVDVPPLVGLPSDAAVKRCREVRLGAKVAGSRPAPGTPGGTVIAQEPSPGASVPVGSAVALWLASLDTSVLVPDLRGRPSADAAELAKSAGLTLAVSGSAPSVDRADVVLSQDLLPGTRAPAGSAVNVVLSVAGVSLPDVVNSDIDSARAQLQQLGLAVNARPVRTSEERADQVFSQNPPAGTVVAVGSTVDLTYGIAIFRKPSGIDLSSILLEMPTTPDPPPLKLPFRVPIEVFRNLPPLNPGG